VKLLLYSHYFAPGIGGVETIVMSLARGLAELRAEDGAREWEVTLATQTARQNFDDANLPFPVVREPGLWRLLQLVRAADAVHIAGPSFAPMLFAWLAGKPFVVEHHTYQAICPNGLLIHQPDRAVCPGHFQAKNRAECVKCQTAEVSRMRGLIKVMAGFPRLALVRRAAANIAVSEHVRTRLAVPRTSVVYHGMDAQPASTEASSSSGNATSAICFAMIGRFVQEKGIHVFIEALAMLRQEGLKCEAKLIGDGPERANIEAQLKAAKLESIVKITGYLSGEELAAEVSNVSVVVMPSVCEETAGLAAMEQMMRGRLAICSDIGGLAEIVGDAGLKFPAGDASALAACLRRVAANPGLAKSFGEKAQRRGQELFARKRMIANHAAIYARSWKKRPG